MFVFEDYVFVYSLQKELLRGVEQGCSCLENFCKQPLHKKKSFPLGNSSVDLAADLVTFTEEILNRKPFFVQPVL